MTTPAPILPRGASDSGSEAARSSSRAYWIVPLGIVLGGAMLAWLLAGSPATRWKVVRITCPGRPLTRT